MVRVVFELPFIEKIKVKRSDVTIVSFMAFKDQKSIFIDAKYSSFIHFT